MSDAVQAGPATSLPERPTPLGPAERVHELDVLRGFALFGILLVNVPLYGSPIQLGLSGVEWWPDPLDRATEALIRFVAQGKFYALFSMLFGVGLALQLERLETRGVAARALLERRMLVLLVIGALHAFLVWFGDILMLYALVGLASLPLLRRSRDALVVWTVAGLLVPLVLATGVVASLEATPLDPEARFDLVQDFGDEAADHVATVETARAAYSGSSLSAMLRQRAADVGLMFSYMPFFAPSVLALFLIGFLFGRGGFVRDLPARVPILRRALPGLLAVGLAGTTLSVVAHELTPRAGVPSRLSLLGETGQALGAPALSLAYAATLILLMQTERWRPRLAVLAPVGRMALTNYLMQSLVCTTLFNGYGLGLYGKVGPAPGLLLAVLVFLAQVPLCHWWLARFRFGPAEWVWRSLTYGRVQPMRIAPGP